jgi:hypothetical protein
MNFGSGYAWTHESASTCLCTSECMRIYTSRARRGLFNGTLGTHDMVSIHENAIVTCYCARTTLLLD